MKKLMIMAAFAAAAIVSQASLAKWSVTNIQASPDADVSAGYTLALYEGAAADFDYAKVLDGSLTALDTLNPTKNDTSGQWGAQNSDGFGNFTAGSKKSFYAVVYDGAIDSAKNYIVSADLEKTFPANGAAANWAFGNMALTTTANKFKDSEWTSTGDPTPEPTSGLLLLLGMAGLALRRKQA